MTLACKSMLLFQDGQSGQGDGAFGGGGGPSRTRLDGDRWRVQSDPGVPRTPVPGMHTQTHPLICLHGKVHQLCPGLREKKNIYLDPPFEIFSSNSNCLSFACQVSGSKLWETERSCMCCQESGEREATVSLFCPNAPPDQPKIRKVFTSNNW